MAEMRQTRGREGIVKKSRKLLEAEEGEAILAPPRKRRKRNATARQSSEVEPERVQKTSPRDKRLVEVASNEAEVERPLAGQFEATKEPKEAAAMEAPPRARARRRGAEKPVTEAEPQALQQKSNSPEATAARNEKRRSKRLRSPEPPIGLGISDAPAISPTQVGIVVVTQTSSSEPPQERIASPAASDTAPEIQQAQKPAIRRSKRTHDVEAPSKTVNKDKPPQQITKPGTEKPRKSKRTRKVPRQPGCLQLSPNTVDNDIYLMVQIGVAHETSNKRRSKRRSQEATSPQPKTPDTGKLAKRLFESMRSPV
ncbi:hypothetical protein CBER1_08519 [Cercospora berteroae]|uniref:Uncharacterized protein n=1 Tax=Cercospora berteroae TaxID=357750 RepID=A0A2S6CGK0_9PEZI|nr:hypothetical protein CBER1_08519 [Cercospora berteroae]